MRICCMVSLWIFGLSTAFVGGLLVYTFPVIFDHIFQDLMTIHPGSMSYSFWKELPVPMYMKIYMWNVTNYKDIEARLPGVKPVLQEVGPYVFEEHHQKTKEQWNNDTVSFKQIKTWYFLRDESVGRLDDEIVNINMVAASAAEYARYRMPFYAYTLNDLFIQENVPLFMKAQVWNLTFGGVLDEILAASETFPPSIVIPIPFDRFGWFYPRNGSEDYDGNFTMFTGVELADLGQIKMWNGLPHIREGVYPDYCGQLNGSAGEFFPPKREKTYLDYFSSDLCRSIRFYYHDQTKVKGVPGYKYVLDELFLANETFIPDNACFNPQPTRDHYLPNGLLNVSTCKFDSPAYVSYPHFYLADPALINQFEPGSVRPNKESHECSLSLEPGMGVPLQVGIRMQINGFVRPLSVPAEDGINFVNISLYDGIEPTFYPLIWFETTTELNEEYSEMLSLVLLLQEAIPSAGWVAVAIGLLLFLGGCIVVATKLRRSETEHNFGA